MTPNAKYQAAYRARYVKRGEALSTILDKLEGRTTPLANEVRAIVEAGLK